MIFLSLLVFFICISTIYLWIKVMPYGKEIAKLKSEIYHLNNNMQTNVSQKTDESVEILPEKNTDFNLDYSKKINSTIEKEHNLNKTQNTLENWIGKNVLAIAASILIFIGLIFLGILTYQNIGETGKMVLMYLVSLGITAAGLLLNRKLHNVFTEILSGCGFGCIFISILITHVWFHKINDIAAFTFLLIWLGIAMYTAKRVNSLSLSIVAHLGMVISICMAFDQGMVADKIAIVFIYQLISVAVIVLGNILCFKKTYRFGLFLSMIVVLIGSGYLWEYVGSDKLNAFAVLLFFIEFLCITFLSCLLEFSTNNITDSVYDKPIHIINKLIWMISLLVMVFTVLDNLKHFPFYAVIIVCIIIVAVHGIYSAIITEKFNFSKILESINVILFTVIADFLMIIMLFSNLYGDIGLDNLPEIPMLFIVAFFLYAVYKYTNRIVYRQSAYITLALDAVFMCLIGYNRLDQCGSMIPSIIYMLIFDAVLVWEAMRLYHNNLSMHLYKFMAFGYVFTEISLLTIIVSSNVENKWIILQILLVLLNIILYAVKFDSTKYGQVMRIIMKVNESILLSVSYLIIAFEEADALVHVLKWGLIALCIGLVVIRIRENIAKESLAIEQVWTGLKITLLILSAVNANTDVLDYAYVFSIICMVTSLGCIVLGFKEKAKALRIYGLGTTLLFVVKMVTVDIGEVNSETRVLAFIGGGAICFVISSVYNYIYKNEETD